jgi:hypothetical protein
VLAMAPALAVRTDQVAQARLAAPAIAMWAAVLTAVTVPAEAQAEEMELEAAVVEAEVALAEVQVRTEQPRGGKRGKGNTSKVPRHPHHSCRPVQLGTQALVVAALRRCHQLQIHPAAVRSQVNPLPRETAVLAAAGLQVRATAVAEPQGRQAKADRAVLQGPQAARAKVTILVSRRSAVANQSWQVAAVVQVRAAEAPAVGKEAIGGFLVRKAERLQSLDHCSSQC